METVLWRYEVFPVDDEIPHYYLADSENDAIAQFNEDWPNREITVVWC